MASSFADFPDADFVNGGDGFDTCAVDRLDTYTGCEVVEGPTGVSFLQIS